MKYIHESDSDDGDDMNSLDSGYYRRKESFPSEEFNFDRRLTPEPRLSDIDASRQSRAIYSEPAIQKDLVEELALEKSKKQNHDRTARRRY